MIDDAAGVPAARAASPVALGASREASLGDVEHVAALTARNQNRRCVGTVDELKALEGVPRVDMEGRNATRCACRALHADRLRIW